MASVIADDYETWDDTIKELRVLKSERDPVTGALVEIIWTRYCLRKMLSPPPVRCVHLSWQHVCSCCRISAQALCRLQCMQSVWGSL